MLKFRIPQVKAKGVLRWWGRFRFMFGHAVFYVAAVNMALLGATAYNTTVRDWAIEYLGWNLTFGMFVLIMVAIVTVGFLVEYIISVPALIAESNFQMYEHQSPIKRDFEEVKAKQEELEANLRVIVQHMGLEWVEKEVEGEKGEEGSAEEG